jgi:hypothetical protein
VGLQDREGPHDVGVSVGQSEAVDGRKENSFQEWRHLKCRRKKRREMGTQRLHQRRVATRNLLILQGHDMLR